MSRTSGNIQNNTKQQDTAKVIKAIKILPPLKIKSSEGAIIPKEAIAWIELKPALPLKDEGNSNTFTYILTGVVIIGVLLLVKMLLKNRKKRPD